MLDGLLILLLFQLLGEVLVTWLDLPLPGPVAGMLLLLAALLARQLWAERVAPAATLLIRHLTLLFFPIGVGIALEWDRYAPHGAALALAVLGGTLLALPLVAGLLQWLLRERPHE
jgi:holin-like protein